MLNQVLNYLNNYFYKYTNGVANYTFSKDVTFTSNATLTATDFSDTFIAGEYIVIEGSRLNDGVYLIESIDATTITINTNIDITISTEPETEVTLTKSYIPKELVSLIDEIKTYNTNVSDGVASETQGNRSISYGNSSSGWQMAFKDRLAQYRKLRWC